MGRGGGGGRYLLAGGCGGDSMLLPLANAVRLLGVASRIITFMVFLGRRVSRIMEQTRTHTVTQSPGWGLVHHILRRVYESLRLHHTR